MASIREAGKVATPAVMLSVSLFCLAALIEGFVSPSALPYAVKAGVAITSAAILLIYFLVLGISARITRPAQVDQEEPEPDAATAAA